MGFRFRRSVRLAPGVRLNFSKSGVSTSVGGRGATVNLSKHGTRTTVGLPGTGLSYSTMSQGQHHSGGAQAKAGSATGGIVLASLGLLLVGFCASRTSNPATTGTPAAVAATPVAKAAYVVPATANCRSGPSESASVVRHLPRGTAVTTATVQDGWTTVRDPTAAGCWVASRLLSDAAPISQLGRPQGLRSTSGIASKGAIVASRHVVHRQRRGSAGRALDGGCSCSGSHVCIGPRGGRYCITSGGNKRYGI